MNKYGQAGAGLTLALASVVIVFILILFIVFSSIMTSGISFISKEKSLEISDKNQEMVSLQAYLQTKVKINVGEVEKEILISDLIKLAYSDKTYKSVLQEKTHEILDEVYDKYILHADSLKIVGEIGRPKFAALYLPAEEPIKVIFGVIK